MGCHCLLPALVGVFFTTNATGEALSGYQKQRIMEFRPFLMLLWIVERDTELNHGTQRLVTEDSFLPQVEFLIIFKNFVKTLKNPVFAIL